MTMVLKFWKVSTLSIAFITGSSIGYFMIFSQLAFSESHVPFYICIYWCLHDEDLLTSDTYKVEEGKIYGVKKEPILFEEVECVSYTDYILQLKTNNGEIFELNSFNDKKLFSSLKTEIKA